MLIFYKKINSEIYIKVQFISQDLCETFHMLKIANKVHRPLFATSRSAPAQSPYGENSPNAWRYILRNNRGHKVIVWIGWRVFVTIVALNCMHIYRRRVLVYHPLPSCAEEGWA